MVKVVVDGIDLVDLLNLCQSPQHRLDGEKRLEGLQASHPFQLFSGLAMVLASEDNSIMVRQLAGLVLKNAFSGPKDGMRDKQCREKWAAITQAGEPGHVIKQGIVQALTTSKDLVARKTASQVIAAIATIELVDGKWPELVDNVLLPSVSPNRDVLTRSSALICLSYMSEEFSVRGLDVPQPQVNSMLTAIIQGMKDAEDVVKKDASKALYYAMVLAQKNFGNKSERDVIVGAICDSIKNSCGGLIALANRAPGGLSSGVTTPGLVSVPGSPTTGMPTKQQLELCLASCECLVQLATEYYVYLSEYMNLVGPLSWELMKFAKISNTVPPTLSVQAESITMCAIEFWSTICDEENYIAECIEAEGPSSVVHPSSNLAKLGMNYLIPLLTDLMGSCGTGSHHDDSNDDDTTGDSWNSAMASATCLSLLAKVTGDDCVDPVLQYVNSHYSSPNASFREAAMLAYGSIMDGPTIGKMTSIVQMSLSVIVEALGDAKSAVVRDNAAWTIGRICQFHTKAISPAIPNLVPILLARLAQDKPRVAANVAWIFDILGQEQDSTPELQVQLCGPLFTQIVGGLLNACVRPDSHLCNLRMTGYAAVSSLASHAGKELHEPLLALLDELAVRLENSMSAYAPVLMLSPRDSGAVSEEMRSAIAHLSQGDKECELQGHICGCMLVVTNKLRTSVDLSSRAERIMTLYMHVFSLYQRLTSNSSAVHEETLLAVSSIALNLGRKFNHFMPAFVPVLKTALNNPDSSQVCAMAVGVVGDLARALDADLAQYLDVLVRECLAPLLERKDVDKKLKPLVMTALGDVALASRGQFEPYVPGTVKLLTTASFTRLEDGPCDSEEWIEYLNELRTSVLDAYTGLVHGLREAHKQDLIKDNVQPILEFVVRLIEDKSVNSVVLSTAMGLVGDLVMTYQRDLARLLKEAPFMQRLIAFAASNSDRKIQETGQWLARTVDKFN